MALLDTVQLVFTSTKYIALGPSPFIFGSRVRFHKSYFLIVCVGLVLVQSLQLSIRISFFFIMPYSSLMISGAFHVLAFAMAAYAAIISYALQDAKKTYCIINKIGDLEGRLIVEEKGKWRTCAIYLVYQGALFAQYCKVILVNYKNTRGNLIWLTADVAECIVSVFERQLQLHFIHLVFFTGNAFKMLTASLQQEFQQLRTMPVLHGLSRIRHYACMHEELVFICEMINDAYSVANMATFGIRFIEIIYLSHVMLTQHPPLDDVISFLVWLTIIASKTIVLAKGCGNVPRMGSDMSHALDGFLTEDDDSPIGEELQILSLQLLHRKVEFTACGFFSLDMTLIYSMVGAVTTYLIILVQFSISSRAHGAGLSITCRNSTLLSSSHSH